MKTRLGSEVAETQFEMLCETMSAPNVEGGSMFGKRCIKINGKAFAALFGDSMAFKLNGDSHGQALSLEGATLWDPSGKGRPMKEWVQVPMVHAGQWASFGQHAESYVSS